MSGQILISYHSAEALLDAEKDRRLGARLRKLMVPGASLVLPRELNRWDIHHMGGGDFYMPPSYRGDRPFRAMNCPGNSMDLADLDAAFAFVIEKMVPK